MPDGKTLAASGNGDGIILWEVATGKKRLSLAHLSQVPQFALSPDGWLLAAADIDHNLNIFETGTGRHLGNLGAQNSSIHALAFAPDGRSLASATENGNIVVWNLSGYPDRARLQSEKLSPAELTATWEQLVSRKDDAEMIYRALATLSTAPAQSVPFIETRVRSVAHSGPISEKLIARLVRDLDSEAFSTREAASKALRELGRPAQAQLRQALDNSTAVEARRRLTTILADLDQLSPEEVQGLRAVEVLERIATAEALRVLEGLAKGQPDAKLTKEAEEAVKRLKRRNKR
jgi:hypothetical protein